MRWRGQPTQRRSDPTRFGFDSPRAKLLLLGTFHFKDAGRDGYKSKFDVDILSAERLALGHGHYLIGSFKAGDGTDFPGADHVTGWWYNRNLHTFTVLSGNVPSTG